MVLFLRSIACAAVQELGLEEEEEVSGALDQLDYLNVLPVLRKYSKALRKLFLRCGPTCLAQRSLAFHSCVALYDLGALTTSCGASVLGGGCLSSVLGLRPCF